MVVSTLIPISRAASGSCAVARMALPSRLCAMKVVSIRTSGIVRPIDSASARSTRMPPIVNSSSRPWTRSGTPTGDAPIQSCPTLWRMNEKPTAVISGASLGAPRNGLYATRSIITLSDALVSIETIRQTNSPPTIDSGALVIPRPSSPKSASEVSDPIMNTSPWAKLISSMIP